MGSPKAIAAIKGTGIFIGCAAGSSISGSRRFIRSSLFSASWRGCATAISGFCSGCVPSPRSPRCDRADRTPPSLFLGRCSVPGQATIAIREAAGWFLLIWLLQLHQHPRLVHYIRLAPSPALPPPLADGFCRFSIRTHRRADADHRCDPHISLGGIRGHSRHSGGLCHCQAEASRFGPLAGCDLCVSQCHRVLGWKMPWIRAFATPTGR